MLEGQATSLRSVIQSILPGKWCFEVCVKQEYSQLATPSVQELKTKPGFKVFLMKRDITLCRFSENTETLWKNPWYMNRFIFCSSIHIRIIIAYRKKDWLVRMCSWMNVRWNVMYARQAPRRRRGIAFIRQFGIYSLSAGSQIRQTTFFSSRQLISEFPEVTCTYTPEVVCARVIFGGNERWKQIYLTANRG